MSSQYALKITPDQAKETPMVDLAFMILKSANTPFYYRDLMMEIAKIKGLNDDEVMNVIAQLYTEINIDGRFACVGTNLWGLKRWYPIEKAEDAAVGNTKRPRIINDDDDDLDDEDLFTEDEEETYASDDEDYDHLDEDNIYEDEVEEVEDEEVAIDEEDLDEDTDEDLDVDDEDGDSFEEEGYSDEEDEGEEDDK